MLSLLESACCFGVSLLYLCTCTCTKAWKGLQWPARNKSLRETQCLSEKEELVEVFFTMMFSAMYAAVSGSCRLDRFRVILSSTIEMP